MDSAAPNITWPARRSWTVAAIGLAVVILALAAILQRPSSQPEAPYSHAVGTLTIPITGTASDILGYELSDSGSTLMIVKAQNIASPSFTKLAASGQIIPRLILRLSDDAASGGNTTIVLPNFRAISSHAGDIAGASGATLETETFSAAGGANDAPVAKLAFPTVFATVTALHVDPVTHALTITKPRDAYSRVIEQTFAAAKRIPHLTVYLFAPGTQDIVATMVVRQTHVTAIQVGDVGIGPGGQPLETVTFAP